MRIAVAATPSVAIPTLDWLDGSEHDLALVITQPDRPAGRGQSLKKSQVALWADAHQVPCIKPAKSDELAEPLKGVDLVVTIGYGVILPTQILKVPRYGFINVHFSLLPKWRGAAPVQRAILNGDEVIGLTVFALDEGMDTGPVYVQQEIAGDPYENSGECLQRMADLAPELLRGAIEMIETGTPAIAQANVGATYASKLSKEDARIRWGDDVMGIDRHIRAFTPEPGAWTLWRDAPLRITKAHPYSSERSLAIGEILMESGNLIVGCREGGVLVVEEVTPAGKKTMSAKSWLNGARALPGEFFV